MVSLVHAQIGDVVEFPSGGNGVSTAVTQGRVIDVDPTTPYRCSVQVSAFEPFRQLDLSQIPFKIVYAIGDITKLSPAMIGWEIEIVQDEEGPRPTRECGVIKQVDCDLNCALVAFEDGHKDWRDLTMNTFKVVGRTSTFNLSSPSKSASSISQPLDIADVLSPQPKVSVARAIQAPLSVLEANEFEWYTEGGYVELCDYEGQFHEGALLCSVRDKILQLYNETHQFFEIHMLQQSFKVIVHGLVTLKSVPLGQAIEVYSPMHGDFRRGLVLRPAEVGKLTPIRFDDIGLEWLDLTSQTFKLLFMTSSIASTESIDRSLQDTTVNEPTNNYQIGETVDTQLSASCSAEQHVISEGKSSTGNSSLERRHKHHHDLIPPVLRVGQAVELFDPSTKQFIKYRVVQVYNPEEPTKYDLELTPNSSGSNLALSVARGADAERFMTVDITTVKARVLLTVDDWGTCEPILRGYRVDVYDKMDRSVLSGKIIASTVEAATGPRVHVKLQDGSKRWFDVKHTKIKLKLQGDSFVRSTDPSPPQDIPSTSLISDSMWERVDPPTVEPAAPKMAVLGRQQSEKIRYEPHVRSQLTRQATTPHMTQTSTPLRVPSLDFQTVARHNDEPDVTLPDLPESTHIKVPRDTNRSADSNGEALSDLLPAMDDVWVEESTEERGIVMTRYVHLGTGEVSYNIPQWLKTTNDGIGEAFIVNTVTGVRFQPPGASSSHGGTPRPSDRAAVVTLPIGPIEAARVVNRLTTGLSSADLLAEAFGS